MYAMKVRLVEKKERLFKKLDESFVSRNYYILRNYFVR